MGAADLEGDGRSEIAAVTTPHMGGTPRVYQRRGQQVVEVGRCALPAPVTDAIKVIQGDFSVGGVGRADDGTAQRGAGTVWASK